MKSSDIIEPNAGDSREQEVSTTSGSDVVQDEAPPARTTVSNPRPPSHVRPSKAQRIDQNAANAVGQRLEARRGLRASAVDASNKLRQGMAATGKTRPPHQRPTFPAHKKNVIKTVSVGLKPDRMPPPENGLDIQPNEGDDDGVVDAAIEETRISPHLVRVLRKQYDQHMQWMKSHGVSETGFKKLERDYENLIENHTARVKQMRVEAANQNRISLLKTQKGKPQLRDGNMICRRMVNSSRIELFLCDHGDRGELSL